MTEQRINNVGYIIKRKQMIVDQKQAETCSHGTNKPITAAHSTR